MIRAIGFQKVFLILLLGVAVVALAYYTLSVAQPSLNENQRELGKNKAEIDEMIMNTDKLTQGFAQFQEQKDVFQQVQELGFFDTQNRLEARARFVAMQEESELISAKFNIKPAVVAENAKAKEAGYKVLNTEIDFNLEAIEDKDIYRFLHLLNYGFPGQVIITEFNMKRETEITAPILRQIGVGQPPPLVRALVRMKWQTMVQDDTLSSGNNDDAQTSEAGGF